VVKKLLFSLVLLVGCENQAPCRVKKCDMVPMMVGDYTTFVESCSCVEREDGGPDVGR
jgi:hypothetical protein